MTARALIAARLGWLLGGVTTLYSFSESLVHIKGLEGVVILCSLAGCVCSLAALAQVPPDGSEKLLLHRGMIFLSMSLSLWPWVTLITFLVFCGGLGPGP